jgi:phosphoglycolate phosphatase-like HAD superfamily hydrolase
MIGDSINDQQAAKKAGIDFFQITYFNKSNKNKLSTGCLYKDK